jgi:type II restriction enzyme
MPITVERNKWILYKHTSSYELIKAVALDVKNSCKTDISNIERERMQERLAALNMYKARNPEAKPLDSINHRINTLEYYMFGYEDNGAKKRFMFSPLGNLFLKYINDEDKLVKVFTTMLYAIQFQHPASGTDKEFQLYPFRLIFKLLLDERLEGKIFNFEYAQILAFVTSVDETGYERLVGNILKLRNKSVDEIKAIYKSDEHTYVNAVYEWEYYTCKLLSKVGILDVEKGEQICKLFHLTKTGSKSAPTGRIARNGYVTLNASVIKYVEKLLSVYPFTQEPLKLDDPERMKMDVVKEIYNFYPSILMEEIGESDELSSLLELPKLIEAYSNNPNNDTAYLFEEVLAEGFAMFYNVDAKRIGKAGHTDIECLYITKKKKFAVESKSTANKLIGINVGRLREHREEVGGEYTIVITPRYVPAAKRDIKGAQIVIILASTFAEYLYNHIFHNVRDIDYADFDDIIVDHLGEDVSEFISNMTMSKFAVNS